MTATTTFGINSYSYIFSHAAEACIREWSERGHANFELMMFPGHIFPPDMDSAQRSAFRQAVDGMGARIVTLNMPNLDINLAAINEEMRTHSLGFLKGVVELAGELGVPGVVLGIGKANPLFPASTDRLTGYFFDALDTLVPLAAKSGTALWVENMPFSFVGDAPTLTDMLADYGSDEIGFVYDVANAHFIGEDIADGLRHVKDRLKLVHFSDTNQQVYKHGPVGIGDLPFQPIPSALDEVGYTETLMLEIIAPEDPDSQITDSIKRLRAMGYPA